MVHDTISSRSSLFGSLFLLVKPLMDTDKLTVRLAINDLCWAVEEKPE